MFQYRDDIHAVKDLKPGMVCPGIVTNVTNFGAFVDIGVHQDGLVHISQLADRFVKDPREVVSPGQHVQIKVLEVNFEKNQIALTMKMGVEKSEVQSNRDFEKSRGPRSPKGDRPAGDRPQRAPRAARPERKPEPRVDNRTDEQKAAAAAVRPVDEAGAQKSRPSNGKPPNVKPKSGFNTPFAGLAGLLKK